MESVVIFYVNDKGENLYVTANRIFNFYFIHYKFTRVIAKRNYRKIGVWSLKGFKCQNINCNEGGLVPKKV